MKRRNIRKIMLLSMVFVLIAAMAFPIFGRAENVVVESETNPTLTLENIHEPTDEELPEGWPATTGSLTQQKGKYTLSSDGYIQWGANDSLSFAYKKVDFDYGKDGVLTLQTQLDSWTGTHGNSAAGIMLRSSLDPNAATIFLQLRPASIMVTYRSETGIRTDYDGIASFTDGYPVKFKLELNKSKVKCYYKTASDSDYVLTYTATFAHESSVYIGLACYSLEQGVQRTGTFTGFSYQIEAPEGTELPSGEAVVGGKANPTLTLENIHEPTDEELPEGWPATTGNLTQGDGSYAVSSDGYIQWGANDSLSFAYTQIPFNYGKDGTLICETQLDSWNGTHGNSAAGIMLRSSLDPNAATIFLQLRPASIMVTYRSETGIRTDYDGIASFTDGYPVKFKLELNKSKVKCYYKTDSDSDYILTYTATFAHDTTVYAGLACYSLEQGVQRTGTFSGFSYQVTVPAGTQGSGSGSGSTGDATNLGETNPELALENIHNPFDDELPAGWPQVSGNLTQGDGKYTVSGDGYNCWGANDSVSFAYKKVNFNYGKEAVLTMETQLDSWEGVEGNSAGGMMLRSSLDPNAASIFLQIRPSQILYTYRSATGYRTNYDDVLFAGQYPVKFKMVLTKSKVQCYYQTPADSDFVALGEAVPFGFDGSVYVGLACYSMEQGVQRTASYTGFSYLVEVPEGTIIPGGDGTSSEDKEDDTIIPDDMNLPADVLFRETFTDNSMTEGKASVTNPIWETNNVGKPDIITNADRTNRYLNLEEEDCYYLAGDEKWTDYEMSVDLTFPEGGYIEGAENAVAVHVRLTSIAQYGYASYVVRFINGNTVELGWFQGASEPLATSPSYRILQTLNYDYKNKADVPLHLTMRAFDNHITVYLREGDATESVTLFDYEDLGERTIQVKTEGRIAIATCNATVHVDNIKVVKLEDLLGGDYDNRIQGLYDEPVPKHIQEFIDSKFLY